MIPRLRARSIAMGTDTRRKEPMVNTTRVSLAALAAIAATLLLAGCTGTTEYHPSPTATATIGPGTAPSAASPTQTATAPADGSDGSGDGTDGTATPCTTAQCQGMAGELAALPTVQNFITAYATIHSPNTDLSVWKAGIAPFAGHDLPVTAIARQDSALAGLAVDSKIPPGATSLTVNPSGPPNADGTWPYTAIGTVVATYTTPHGTPTIWTLQATWHITVDPVTGKVIRVTESIPQLKGAP